MIIRFGALCLIALCVTTLAQSTPVIGGLCDLDSEDVEIGGKKTQFFLKCEKKMGSDKKFYGVWVVRSRSSSEPSTEKSEKAKTQTTPITTSIKPTPILTSQQQETYPPQQTYQPPAVPIFRQQLQTPFAQQPRVQFAPPPVEGELPRRVNETLAPQCESEPNAREFGVCNYNDAQPKCLQVNTDDTNTYLQCTPDNRWMKRPCNEYLVFSFQHQACIGDPDTVIPVRSSKNDDDKVPLSVWALPPNIANNLPSLSNNQVFNNVNIRQEGEPTRCPNGEFAITTPSHCRSAADCPQGFYCPGNLGLCCPQPDVLNRCANGAEPSSIPCGSALNAQTCPTNYACDMGVMRCCYMGDQNTLERPQRQPAFNTRLGGMDSGFQQFFQPNDYLQPYHPALPVRQEVQQKILPVQQVAQQPVVNQKQSIVPYTPYINAPVPYKPSINQKQLSNCGSTASCNNVVAPTQASPQCTAGTCATGYECCFGFLCCRQQVQQQTMAPSCPNGAMPATSAPCTGSCPTGSSCTNGACCPQVTVTICPGGAPSSGSCNAGCSSGYSCQSGNVCCPQQSYTCANGQNAVGACINGQCGAGFTCELSSNLCCQVGSSGQPMTCSSGQSAVGACVNGQCGAGFMCETSTNLCCPGGGFACPNNGQTVGPCINGLCGAGFTCINNQCCGAGTPQILTCPAGQVAVGPCISNSCGGGALCVNNVCCVQSTGFNNGTCTNGGTSVGPCIQGLCGAGFTCINEQCCSAGSGGGTTTPTTCANGVPSAGPCVTGTCGGGLVCVANSFCCPTDAVPSTGGGGSCPNNAVAVGPCNNGVCGAGFLCLNNVCCPQSGGTGGNIGSCPDGQAAVGSCINGVCGAGFTCSANNLCCPGMGSGGTSISNLCPSGQAGVGACISGLCGVGFTCDTATNLCCPVSSGMSGNVGSCSNGIAAVGTCITGQVCGIGFTCDSFTNRCCPTSSASFGMSSAALCSNGQQPAGGCIGGNSCGSGYSCESTRNLCCQNTAPTLSTTFQCGSNVPAAGGCLPSGGCGFGYSCSNNLCCPQSSSSGSSGSNVFNLCPNGQTAVGGCVNGQCGAGFTCQSTAGGQLCCPSTRNLRAKEGNTAPRPDLSTMKNTPVMTIGSYCTESEQCVGNLQGLSTCQENRCTCNSNAYKLGVRCVRRRLHRMQMNDDASVEAVNATSVNEEVESN